MEYLNLNCSTTSEGSDGGSCLTIRSAALLRVLEFVRGESTVWCMICNHLRVLLEPEGTHLTTFGEATSACSS